MAMQSESVTFSPPILATDVAVLQAMVGATVTPPAQEDFPADPTQALTPSPDNSEITLYQGKILGEPYLKDANYAVHTLSVAADGMTTTYEVNGVAPIQSEGQVQLLLVRQGYVYAMTNAGVWQQAQGSYLVSVSSLPLAFVTGSSGSPTTPLPPLPPMPTPASTPPGSSGRVIQCGVGQTLTTLSAAIPTAQAGDTIQVSPGTYTDTPPAWSVPLLIDLGGATFNGTGQDATLARNKGLLVPCADSIIQNGTILGVGLASTSGDLTSAIRPDSGCGYLTIKNMQIHGNQCAVGEGTIGTCVIELDSCDISGNGLLVNSGDLTHNLYVGADCVLLTLINVTSTGPLDGHAIKYRGPQLVVSGGTFASSVGKPFDIPNGSTVPFNITNATVNKTATDSDHGILGFAEEAETNGLAGGTFNGGTINALCPNPYIIGPGGTINLSNVTVNGGPITTQGGIALTGS